MGYSKSRDQNSFKAQLLRRQNYIISEGEIYSTADSYRTYSFNTKASEERNQHGSVGSGITNIIHSLWHKLILIGRLWSNSYVFSGFVESNRRSWSAVVKKRDLRGATLNVKGCAIFTASDLIWTQTCVNIVRCSWYCDF